MKTSRRSLAQLSFLFLISLCTSRGAFADACSALSALKLPDTTDISAVTVTPGGLAAQPDIALDLIKRLPSFCRVTLKVAPSTDSDIEIEVWMPSSGWNGNFIGRGNGGFAGNLAHQEMAIGILNGYASASTDTGHKGSVLDGMWAIHHPQKVTDYGYRAIHEMTVKAKLLIDAFYGRSVQSSFYGSCSNGGRAGLMEAQRFPADYNGILVGAPANNLTRNFSAFVWNMQALFADPASQIPPEKLETIHSAVLAACDAKDGVKDGVIADPRACNFNPDVLVCKKGETNSCLTIPQIDALKKIYVGPVNAKHEQVYPGLFPGSELGPGGWAGWINSATIDKSGQYLLGHNFYAGLVFEDSRWDYKDFQLDRDVKIADDKLAYTLNATDPNLKAFAALGGKLIIYHGWGDAVISPLDSIAYYDAVLATLGSAAQNTIRLYMVPGMQHCDGGSGANVFGQHELKYDPERSVFSAMERWVKTGKAPEAIIATEYKDPADSKSDVVMTRPICPYPQMAKYNGRGDTNVSSNFNCTKP